MNSEILISTENLNLEFIQGFLSNTYWAKGRTLETMQTLLSNSLNFGVFIDKQQIGYGRVVSDYAQFAYLMDVFISDEHRGKGYAKDLMHYILTYEALKEVKVWRLATHDAHGLYEKFGFGPLKNPEKLMELVKS